jgi:flagellar motility protein MotE (MotC chaperone)
MESNEESQTLSGKARFFYLILLPLIFTLALIGTGVMIIHQGKSDNFASALLQAGKSAISAGKQVTGLAIGQKSNPSVPTGTTGTPSPSNVPNTNGQQPAATSVPAGTASGQGSNAAAQANQQQGANPSNQPVGVNAAGASPDPLVSSADLKQKTQEMASEYSKMPPSKAASIISNMSVKDSIFTMVGMKTQQRSDILMKMDPVQAAKLSTTLEHFPPSSTMDTTALQQQLDSLPSTPVPLDEAVKTYNQIPDKSAAVLIGELMKTDETQAIRIMSSIDANKRAQILSAMISNKTDPNGIKAATTLSAKLLQSQS